MVFQVSTNDNFFVTERICAMKMKELRVTTRLASTIVFALACHTLFTNPGEGAVIRGDAIIVPDSSGFFGDYQLGLSQSIPSGGGLFGIGIRDMGSGNFQFEAFAIAEAYSLHRATQGESFSPLQAQTTPAVADNFSHPGPGLEESTVTIPINESVFLSYWDDRSGDDVPTSNDNYGWVEIKNTILGLVAVDSATAIGGGIIVGSAIQIPEPQTLLLVLAGSVTLLARRRRTRREDIARVVPTVGGWHRQSAGDDVATV